MENRNDVMVFGSNLAGIHGAGAAHAAMNLYFAKWGKGVGHHGNSYAIPTKDERIRTLPLARVAEYVDDFIVYARKNPELTFYVTKIGCGLAGFKESDIAPLFVQCLKLDNVLLPRDFLNIMAKDGYEESKVSYEF
jgi:hypothetical protein